MVKKKKPTKDMDMTLSSYFWLIITVCPHTRNSVSAEKTLGVGCEHPHLSNSHAKLVKTLCFEKKKCQSSSWQRYNATFHRVNNTNKLILLCTPISAVSLFSDTSVQAAEVEFILSDPKRETLHSLHSNKQEREKFFPSGFSALIRRINSFHSSPGVE